MARTLPRVAGIVAYPSLSPFACPGAVPLATASVLLTHVAVAVRSRVVPGEGTLSTQGNCLPAL